MDAITIKNANSNVNRGVTKSFNPFKLLLNKYLEYITLHSKEQIYWYMKVIIVIPCVVMVPTISVMQVCTPHFVWFIGLCMVFFFSNIIVHVAETTSRVYIPLYHLSITVMILIPLVTYIIMQW